MNYALRMVMYIVARLLILIVLEGAATFGYAFRFEQYNWFGWTIQVLFVILAVCIAIWGANEDHAEQQKKKPIAF